MTEKLKELRSTREEINKTEKRQKDIVAQLKKMPDMLSSSEEDEIIREWTASRRALKNSDLVEFTRFVANLGDAENNGFEDVQDKYMCEISEASQFARLLDLFDTESFDEIPFVNKDPKSLSHYKLLMTRSSVEENIVSFFQKEFDVSDSEKEGLVAVQELIKWLVDRGGVADKLLRERLQLQVSSKRLLALLREEEKGMVEQEKLSQLEALIASQFSRTNQVIDDFEVLRKRYVKAFKNHEKLSANQSIAQKERQLSLREDGRVVLKSLNSLKKTATDLQGFISRNAPDLKTGSISEISEAIRQQQKSHPGSEKTKSKIERLSVDLKALRSEAEDISAKLRIEQSKNESSMTPEECEKVAPYVRAITEFSRFCNLARKSFDEREPTELGDKIRNLFGDVALRQLGGEILFDGEKRELVAVDFQSESLVFVDGSEKRSLPWNRLGTGNSAALFLNSTLHNVIQQGKKIVALVDEVGDMDSQSRNQAFKSVRANSDAFSLFLTAEPSEQNQFIIEQLK